MGLLDIFKFRRAKPLDLNPKKSIKVLIEYLPEEYKSHSQYRNCVEFLKSNELGLALDSLSELAIETGHYFSIEFWDRIRSTANKLNLSGLVRTAEKEKRRVKRTENVTPYFGSTVQKIDDTHYQHYISDIVKSSWDNDRRKKDKISLEASDGLHYKPNGRSGTFYYIESGRLAEIYYELGSLGLIVNIYDLYWSLPSKTKCTDIEIQRVKDEIDNFSKLTGNTINW